MKRRQLDGWGRILAGSKVREWRDRDDDSSPRAGLERLVEKPREREGWEISNFGFRNVALLRAVSVNLAELRRVAP